MRLLQDYLGLDACVLGLIDPLELNLVVARGIHSLAHLDVEGYKGTADQWAEDLSARLPGLESQFHASPAAWKNDPVFFRLGVLCWYVDEVLGIRYREDQKGVTSVLYTDPCDLFLNGVMDSRRGTCANMAALHVALGWRLGWPVSLACAQWHILCRYDDGRLTHNIEATNNGRGGFHSHPDEYYQREYGIPDCDIRCGSDLAALRPRALLGLFLGLRARHWEDIGRQNEAAADYGLAWRLFPNRRLFREAAAHFGRSPPAGTAQSRWEHAAGHGPSLAGCAPYGLVVLDPFFAGLGGPDDV
jgi:hypothetical protein